VYGLGALAIDAGATGRIFAAKDRPPGSPLIVLVDSSEMARRYAAHWPREAEMLAQAFWPGPLSLVLPKTECVPAVVSGGGDTVGLRAPDHPVALALIAACGEGLAAPSANRASRLPPMRASHVLKGLDGRIDLVLDAGACPGGLESTVLDLSQPGPARVLRRGAVSLEQLRELLEVDDAEPAAASGGGWTREASAEQIAPTEQKTGALLLRARELPGAIEQRVLGSDPRAYASSMYDALHELEDAGCELVWVERLPSEPAWDAIRDRLRRL
jgi:L-threonylcarbamoyladenylate synthase